MVKNLLSGLAVLGLLASCVLATGCENKATGVSKPAGDAAPAPVTGVGDGGGGSATGGGTAEAPGPATSTPAIID